MGYKRLLTIITIFGSIASIIALLVIFFPKNNIATMDIITSSVDCLTDIEKSKEPGFQINFNYKGKSIKKLWKVNVEFTNSSSKTFVGQGKLQNTLSDTLEIYIQKDFDIIDKKLLSSDIEHWLEIQSFDTIRFAFSQWRQDESFKYSFYIKSDTSNQLPAIMFFQPKERQLLDGEIHYSMAINQGKNDKTLITEFLPKKVKKAIYIIILVFLGLMIIVFILMIVANPIGFARRKKWLNKNRMIYRDFINTKFYSNQSVRNRFIDNPERLQDWEGYPNSKYPSDLTFDFGNKGFGGFISVMIFLVVFQFSMVIIFMDIVQIFP